MDRQTKRPTQEKLDAAIGDAGRRLAVDITDEFLRHVNLQATWRGMTVREYVIESILWNSVEIKGGAQ
jgi:hypothetical protein